MEKKYKNEFRNTLKPKAVSFRRIDGCENGGMPIENLEQSVYEIDSSGETVYKHHIPEGKDRGYERENVAVGIGETMDPIVFPGIEPPVRKPAPRYKVRVKIIGVDYGGAGQRESLTWEEFIKYNRPRTIERTVSTTTTLRF